MAFKLSNVLVSFVLFAVLTSLFSSFYGAIAENYGITETDTIEDETIMQKLEKVVLLDGIKRIVTAGLDITNPSSTFDIIGGFLSVALGVFQIATGLISFPVEIIGIVTGFYPALPPIIAQGLGLIFIIYITIMVLNKSTGGND